jgi:hypothetical protein
MCSAPSRDRLASTSAMIAFRDRPAPFGPSCIRPWTLVAITNSSRTAEVPQGPADDLLAGAGGVHIRCVEKVDPRLNCLTDQRSAALLVQRLRVGATLRVAEAHAAQHEPRNLQPRAPQTYVFHRSSSLLWPRRSSAAITGSCFRSEACAWTDGGKRGRFYASASRRPRSRTLLQTRSQSPSAVMSGVWPAPSSVGRGMNAVPSPARWANGRSRLRAAAYRGSCRPRSRTTPSGAVIGEAIRTRPRGYGHQLTVAPPASQAESVSSQASSLRTGRSWTPPHILRPGHVGQALDGRHACDRNA